MAVAVLPLAGVAFPWLVNDATTEITVPPVFVNAVTSIVLATVGSVTGVSCVGSLAVSEVKESVP